MLIKKISDIVKNCISHIPYLQASISFEFHPDISIFLFLKYDDVQLHKMYFGVLILYLSNFALNAESTYELKPKWNKIF